jgi:flagellar motor switch protein FliM
VIQLDKDAGEPLIGYIDGLEKLTGYVGVQRGFQAFKIKDLITIDCES